MKAHDYQVKSVNETAQLIGKGLNKILFQMATGAGKTVSFSYLIERWLKRYDSKVVIFVHREELLNQAENTLQKFGIKSQQIVSGVHFLRQDVNVYIAMIETAQRKLKHRPNWFGEVGLVIIDECHIGNFRKIYDYFPSSKFIGFSATPISAVKKIPLKTFYEDIVTAIDIPDLIDMGKLCENITYSKDTGNRSNLKVVRGEFSDKEMGNEFSKTLNVDNVVKYHEKYSKGKKNLIFNVNLAHNKLVHEAFLKAGYNSLTLDGSTSKEDRKNILKKFKDEDDIILNNVGVLTAGFDEPSIMSITINRSTMSLPLWLQMTGRGARTFKGKDQFTIIDLGGNATVHGDWSAQRNWKELFYNPIIPKGGGVAPIKECPSCEAFIAASSFLCKFCGHEIERKQIFYDLDINLVKFGDIPKIRDETIVRNSNPYRTLHVLKDQLIEVLKKNYNSGEIDEITHNAINTSYQLKVKEWCKLEGKKYNKWHQETTKEWLDIELHKQFKILIK